MDGWQRGFDVEFNGVGMVEVGENGDDSSDWDSDVSDDGTENRPAGYSALASEPPSQLTDGSTATSDETSQREVSDHVSIRVVNDLFYLPLLIRNVSYLHLSYHGDKCFTYFLFRYPLLSLLQHPARTWMNVSFFASFLKKVSLNASVRITFKCFFSETAESIRKAVAGLKLPAPAWAKEISDSELLKMVTAMQEN